MLLNYCKLVDRCDVIVDNIAIRVYKKYRIQIKLSIAKTWNYLFIVFWIIIFNEQYISIVFRDLFNVLYYQIIMAIPYFYIVILSLYVPQSRYMQYDNM